MASNYLVKCWLQARENHQKLDAKQSLSPSSIYSSLYSTKRVEPYLPCSQHQLHIVLCRVSQRMKIKVW